MDINLRKANGSDISFLLSLRDKTMRLYLEQAGMATSQEEYIKRIRFEFENAQIVEMAGNPIGLFKVTYSHKRNYWYIVQIQIEPDYQGMSIGSYLINQLIEKAKDAGATVGLSVINTNPARHLYSRLGFEVSGTNGSETLMELTP